MVKEPTTRPTRTFRIYSLLDPDTNAVVYVGRTFRKLEERFGEHIRSAWDGEHRLRTPFALYLRNLITQEPPKYPIIKEIEVVSRETANEREAFWIKHYGKDLLNLAHNDGRPNPKRKKEVSK